MADQRAEIAFVQLRECAISIEPQCDAFGIARSIKGQTTTQEIRKRGIFNRTNDLATLIRQLGAHLGYMYRAVVVDMLDRIIQKD